MKRTLFCMILLGIVLCLLAGCTSYYRVTDPRTENVYYTTGINKRPSGAIELTDQKTKKQVTLQNSEIEEISQEEYNIGIYNR